MSLSKLQLEMLRLRVTNLGLQQDHRRHTGELATPEPTPGPQSSTDRAGGEGRGEGGRVYPALTLINPSSEPV